MTERIDADVRRELSRFGTAGAISDVTRAWPSAVGETIAANAWPARLGRDGTIYVSTGSSAWAFELTQLEGEIGARLADLLSEARPRRIRFSPGELPEQRADTVPRERRKGPAPTAADRAHAVRIAAQIGDEELRALVARAAAASLARASADRSL